MTNSLKLSVVLALAGACLAPSIARADDEAANLTGTWKRDGDPARIVRLDYDAATGELVGKMLNPPEEDPGKPYTVNVRLKLDGKKLTGRATWGEDNPAKDKPGQPPRFFVDAVWEFEVADANKLTGRSEYVEWNPDGVVAEKGWEPHSFERLPSVSVGSNAVGPDKVEAGAAIDAGALDGTWRTSQGWAVAFKPADGGWNVERIGTTGTGDFPASLHLASDANVLKGSAKFASVETAVELKLASPGKLEGRAERVEGDKKSWSAWSLERLARIDGPADATAAEPAALAAGTGTAFPSLDWKRDDGHFLKLTAKDGGGFTGELVSKTGESVAKVELAAADGKLVGKATFTVGGAPVEAHWELALQADGSVEARCEWLDWDAASKTAIARGFAVRKFKALRRVG